MFPDGSKQQVVRHGAPLPVQALARPPRRAVLCGGNTAIHVLAAPTDILIVACDMRATRCDHAFSDGEGLVEGACVRVTVRAIPPQE
jgi:hypothetical protein